jgi:ketosteroid isomerase-like protein
MTAVQRSISQAGHANIETVKRLFDAFERRDIEAALEFLHPAIRLIPVTAHFARGGRAYEGHDGIREYMLDVDRLWHEVKLVPREFEAVGHAVVVIGEVHARGPRGELSEPTVWTWKMRDGLAVEGRVHSDVRSAREALGES